MKKLKELSFDKIASSFEVYHHAYTVTSNEVLKLGILFLQKKYSEELIVYLKQNGLLKEKYVSLLFNTHLKTLDTRWLSECSWETTVETFARIGPSLEKVRFDVDDETDTRWKAVVCHLPNVRIIDYAFYCFDEFLQEIAKYCPKLEELDLYKSYDLITDVGIKYLCQRKRGVKRNGNGDENWKVPCPLLKSIILKRTGVGMRGVQQLMRNQPLLEKLMHEDLEKALYAMHKKNIYSLDKIRKRYNIAEMNLSQFRVQDEDFEMFWQHGRRRNCPPYGDILKICFTVCTELKSIHVPIMELEHLNTCAILPGVENLMLEFVKGSRIDINLYLRKRGENLKYLALFNGGTVSLNVLRESCNNLGQLLLHGTVIQYNEEEPVPLFNSLKEFYIPGLSNSDSIQELCIILRSSPNLETLCLFDCESLPSEIKSEILKCCELLALTFTVFTGKFELEFLKDVLLKCTTLKKMKVSYSNFEELQSFALTLPNRPEITLH